MQLHRSSRVCLIKVKAKAKCAEQQQTDRSRAKKRLQRGGKDIRKYRGKEYYKHRKGGWLVVWWCGGRTHSSLSEDIYILQSAPWIRIVEFPLIKEEGNVFTIKPDAQNEWLGEAWTCRSRWFSASPLSLMKQPRMRGSPRMKIQSFCQCQFFPLMRIILW